MFLLLNMLGHLVPNMFGHLEQEGNEKLSQLYDTQENHVAWKGVVNLKWVSFIVRNASQSAQGYRQVQISLPKNEEN